jgi:hypothetical protein
MLSGNSLVTYNSINTTMRRDGKPRTTSSSVLNWPSIRLMEKLPRENSMHLIQIVILMPLTKPD